MCECVWGGAVGRKFWGNFWGIWSFLNQEFLSQQRRGGKKYQGGVASPESVWSRKMRRRDEDEDARKRKHGPLPNSECQNRGKSGEFCGVAPAEDAFP